MIMMISMMISMMITCTKKCDEDDNSEHDEIATTSNAAAVLCDY